MKNCLFWWRIRLNSKHVDHLTRLLQKSVHTYDSIIRHWFITSHYWLSLLSLVSIVDLRTFSLLLSLFFFIYLSIYLVHTSSHFSSLSSLLIRKARGVDDMGNSFGAGFIAGFVRGIQTRSPKTMMYSGIIFDCVHFLKSFHVTSSSTLSGIFLADNLLT